jgi:hypothetical protein
MQGSDGSDFLREPSMQVRERDERREQAIGDLRRCDSREGLFGGGQKGLVGRWGIRSYGRQEGILGSHSGG